MEHTLLFAGNRTNVPRYRNLPLMLLIMLALSSSAWAQTILGLGTITGSNFRGEPVGAQGLVLIDATTGAALNLAPLRITGVATGQTLIGIDYRPIDNLLYALGYDASTAGANAQLYLLNAGTNVASPIGSAIRLELGGPAERIGFDFNPTVDRIRVVSTNNANYRLVPTTGAIAFMDGNLAYAGGSPADAGVGAAAYTNSFVGTAATTTLYDFDYLNNGLLSIQSPPNNGTLTTQSTVRFVITGGTSPGNYAVGSPTDIGLDIFYNPSTNTNVGYVTEVTEPRANGARASNTYRLDLATGVATQLGNTVPASALLNFEIRDLAVSLLPPPNITWNGSVSTDWTTAANWTPATVPTAATDVVIPGGTPNQPTLSTNQQTHALTLTSGAVLTTADGSNLVVGGNWTNNGGTLAGNGSSTVILDLNTAQTIGGTSPTIFQNLTIGLGTATLAPAAALATSASVRRLLTLYGDLTVTGQAFTLLSDANNTAQVVNIGGSVIGAATVQRYIEPSRNAGLGYRHYSPPVSGSTVADLATTGYSPVVNGAYNTVGNTVTPFPTVFGYNEQRVTTSGNPAPQDFDKGYFSPNSLGDALEVTRGYTVNIAATANVDFVGTLNNGPLTAGGLTRGGQAESGYHLRGNPYPAPLDWNLIIGNGRLTNVDNALYVFKSSGQYTGSYASYINGAGANGGTNVLPSSQGFFVRTSAPGLTGSIAFTNAERLTTYNNTAFQRGTADTRPQLTLALANATARTQTVVYFQAGATVAFDRAYDAVALPNSNGLALATETGTESLAINGLPALTGGDVLLPLHLSVAAPGPYTLAVDDLANLPANYHAYLRDALTGTFTSLATTPAISLNLTASATGRYALFFTTQPRVLASAPAALARLASVYPNPAHGSATLLLPWALRGTQATAVSVVDNLGRTVLTRTLAAGAAETLELPLNGLTPGIYSVLARTAAGLVAKRLVVQ
jgi:hypothetical protein